MDIAEIEKILHIKDFLILLDAIDIDIAIKKYKEHIIIFKNKKYINYKGLSQLLDSSDIDTDRHFMQTIEIIFTDLLKNNLIKTRENIKDIENHLL
jgi:hypothetical protein